MTDSDFLLRILADGEWHELNEILDESHRQRGCRLTVHSRAASLRAKGYRIDTMQRRNKQGRTDSFYKLVGTFEETVAGLGLVDPPAKGSATVSSSVPGPLAAASLSVPDARPWTPDFALTLFDAVNA